MSFSGIEYVDYTDESMLKDIQRLVTDDLSEPYSIFTYRYFLHQWPQLCICAYSFDEASCTRGEMIGTIVSKAEDECGVMRGYLAMLAVNKNHRKKGIGLELSKMNIDRMEIMGCMEIVLEAEATNHGALGLYAKLGFFRDERMQRYYLNGGDAYRLKLVFDPRLHGGGEEEEVEEAYENDLVAATTAEGSIAAVGGGETTSDSLTEEIASIAVK